MSRVRSSLFVTRKRELGGQAGKRALLGTRWSLRHQVAHLSQGYSGTGTKKTHAKAYVGLVATEAIDTETVCARHINTETSSVPAKTIRIRIKPTKYQSNEDTV